MEETDKTNTKFTLGLNKLGLVATVRRVTQKAVSSGSAHLGINIRS